MADTDHTEIQVLPKKHRKQRSFEHNTTAPDRPIRFLTSRRRESRGNSNAAFANEVENVDESESSTPPTSYGYLAHIQSFKASMTPDDKSLPKKVREYYTEQLELITSIEIILAPKSDQAKDDTTAYLKKHERTIKILTKTTLGLNIFLLIFKVVGAVISHSLSVISSVVDSAVDLLTGVILIWTARKIKKRDTYKYPGGRTRLEPISIVILSVIMCSASIEVIFQSGQTLSEDAQYFANKKNASSTKVLPSIEMSAVPIAAMAVTIVTKAVLFVLCYRIKNPTMSALAEDSRNDVASNIVALVCGLIASNARTGKIKQEAIVIDPIGAILISIYIIIAWILQANRQVRNLTGLSAEPHFLQRITHIIYNYRPNVITKIDSVQAVHLGTNFFLEIDIGLPGAMPLAKAHDIGADLQEYLETLDEVERAFVHLDFEFRHMPPYENMNQSSSKINRTLSDDDNTESENLSPRIKRHCQSSCILIDLTPDDFDENKAGCKSCGKQETLLKTFNCPSLHYFCLNCIFNWTQKHVQTKTPPICLVEDCSYSLKVEDLDDLPISIKDHQILLQLMELKIDNNDKTTNLRIKCDKCYLYIDQHNFYTHHNECLGRSLTIPCEICYCPVLINDYEQHMLICNNDDNSTLSQFLYKHLQNPNIDEKMIKLFICSWQRKHRGTIDIYEMIEEFNQTNVLSKELCQICKNTVRSDEFYFLNCENNHSLCLVCYKQHIQNQMNNNQILTCHQCSYHLQDKDLSETHIFTTEQILFYQNYQNNRTLQSYRDLYGSEDTFDINPSIQQSNGSVSTTTNNDDIPRRKCELCLKQHSYGNIFVLNCNCKICYDCFANEVYQQQTKTNELLICSLCRSPIKHNDLGNLRLTDPEIQKIQLYQQGKLFEYEHATHFNKQKNNQTTSNDDNDDDNDIDIILLNQQQCLPKYWILPMSTNFSRHTINSLSTEYKFVADRFNQSWANFKNQPPAQTPPHPLPIRTALPPSVIVPSTNNHPSSYYPTALLQQIAAMQPSTNNNNNNGSIINQPPLPPQPNHNFAHMPYPIPLGANTMIQPASLPPLAPPPQSQPPPHPVYFPQQMYQAPIPKTRSKAVYRLPTNNTIAPTHSSRPANQILSLPTILQIERIQNQRWYKQYSAHECEFRQKLGKQTEQWLFHGCNERSSKNIEMECFNRSYAGQHAVAFGQGCYFARDSLYSHSFALPDRNGIRRMFLARVLVGNTTQGNSTMRVAPAGFDTTGDGHSIFVTYHDSQAYAEYLISYR